uniref:F-box domain-containing protein n=1 Tax=viral metagenome TaxID=1070528 RepID=A0A6C0JPQ5_9ZZZZ
MFPSEIYEIIFSHLPAQRVLIYKRVCKMFENIISSERFLQLYFLKNKKLFKNKIIESSPFLFYEIIHKQGIIFSLNTDFKTLYNSHLWRKSYFIDKSNITSIILTFLHKVKIWYIIDLFELHLYNAINKNIKCLHTKCEIRKEEQDSKPETNDHFEYYCTFQSNLLNESFNKMITLDQKIEYLSGLKYLDDIISPNFWDEQMIVRDKETIFLKVSKKSRYLITFIKMDKKDFMKNPKIVLKIYY